MLRRRPAPRVGGGAGSLRTTHGRGRYPPTKRGRKDMAQPARARWPAAAVARLGHGFVAGFLATLVFHQSGLALLHRVGLFSGPAFNMQPVPPFGVPAVIQLAFWGGVWGIVFVLVERVVARAPGGYGWARFCSARSSRPSSFGLS